jgi:DNA-binding IscR family transcriptional regulator
MRSRDIAREIRVSEAETAKVMQLLVWGGFVTSRRGSRGGFQLATSASKITAGEVIAFFLSRHPPDDESSSPVMQALRETSHPCQSRFEKLTLAAILARPRRKSASSNQG